MCERPKVVYTSLFLTPHLEPPKDIVTKRREYVSGTWLYHRAKVHADRLHRRRDICPRTKKKKHASDLISNHNGVWRIKNQHKSVSKTYVRQTLGEGQLQLCATPGRVHNVLDLSLRPSVCLFVYLLPTCERYTSKTSEPISTQIGINFPPGQRHKRCTSGVRRSKVKIRGGRTAEDMFGSLAETSFSIPSVE